MFNDEFLDFQNAKGKDLATEVDIVTWTDLVRHFAFGRLIVARKSLTLIEAAELMRDDNASRLKSLMENGEFGVPTQEEANLWHDKGQSFEVLVIDPFVLVTPVDFDA